MCTPHSKNLSTLTRTKLQTFVIPSKPYTYTIGVRFNLFSFGAGILKEETFSKVAVTPILAKTIVKISFIVADICLSHSCKRRVKQRIIAKVVVQTILWAIYQSWQDLKSQTIVTNDELEEEKRLLWRENWTMEGTWLRMANLSDLRSGGSISWVSSLSTSAHLEQTKAQDTSCELAALWAANCSSCYRALLYVGVVLVCSSYDKIFTTPDCLLALFNPTAKCRNSRTANFSCNHSANE